MSENTVATTTTATTEAPEGFVSIKDLVRVALAAKVKNGWCDEIDRVLTEDLGIKLPEEPKVRFVIEIPAKVMDDFNSRSHWMNADGTLRTEEYENELSHVLSATAYAISVLRDRVSGYRESESRAQARKVLNAATIELIPGEVTK